MLRRARRAAARAAQTGAPKQLVAGLEQPAALAARHHARHQQRAVLCGQRLHPGLSDQHRPWRLDRHGARLDERLRSSSPPSSAGDGGADSASELAVHGLRPADRAGPDRHRVRRRLSGSSAPPRSIGFAASVTFVVTFGLPAILSPPDDVHRMAGGMFTISYTIAVIIPIVCGALWDLTGLPWTAFMPMALCGDRLDGVRHSADAAANGNLS